MIPPHEPQTVRMFPEDKRTYISAVPDWAELGSGAVYTIQTSEARNIDVKPFQLFDPAGTCPAIVQQYAKGRSLPVPQTSVTFARNLLACGNGLFLSGSGHLLEESCIRQHHGYPQPDGSVEIRNTKPATRVTKRIQEPTIIINGVFGLHFSHWAYDNFSRLTFLRQYLKNFAGYKVAVGFGNRRGGWCKPGTAQFDCLSFLGFTSDDIIMIPEHDWFEFDKAIVMSEVNNFVPPAPRIWNAPELFGFYDEVFELAGLERRKPTKRVNLSRVDNNNRKCVNEQEVVDLTNAAGFENRTMAGMSMSDQMQYFSDIDVLVGPAGNNLMTMFAMQPGSKIVTFFPPRAAHILVYYQNYCSARGLELYAVCGSDEHWEGQQGVLDNLRWSVDVASMKAALEQALVN